MTGDCVLFSLGETVALTDTAVFSGLVQVRKRGDMKEFWVITEAINKY